ncbi:TIGR04222 domain-containing membrane protein [Hymenobacter terrenus]|uniref:TIGR04222 domain-containing membrane protein n=1 Tax=Hymenobacter terrenus TaxID=1629124 RepID=UPI0009E35122|nr:TIGR04222 domain-containing membrane protein [Hymenobacter terrenus]
MSLLPSRVVPADLWDRLVALDLDGGATLSFSKRLARDNGWSVAFAQRVVLEYKRFVFLAATCGHPVTPSDEVDQAWHLHLVYTHSYWDELCGRVLGFPLHHGPTQGGVAEGHKFQDWYARTLQAYTAAFGTVPPADIWPPAAVRFGEAPYFRRVNLRRQWLLPRPRWNLRLGWRSWLGLAGALVLASCTARTPLNPLDWYGTEFLWLFWGLCFTLLPLAAWARRRGQGAADEHQGPLPGTYELARLVGPGQRLAHSALAALVYTGKAELAPERRICRTDADPPTDPYERAVWNLITPDGGSNLDKISAQAVGANIGALQVLDASLEAKGLLLPPAERQRLDRYPFLTTLALGLFGLAKVAVGIARDRPVGFLLASLLGLFLIGACFKATSTWATGRGGRLLRHLVPIVRQQRKTEALSGAIVALSVAFFGVTELNALGMSTMATYLSPPSQTSGDGSSGCGSSGCGGSGCGGCGGD